MAKSKLWEETAYTCYRLLWYMRGRDREM